MSQRTAQFMAEIMEQPSRCAERAGDGILLSSFKRDYRAKRGEDERPLIARLTLHAERIRFVDLNGTAVEVSAELPKDLRSVLTMLRKYAGR